MASMTDYSKWAAYDAEADINEVDVEEQREDRERLRRKARRDLQDFENKVVALALDVAGAATSRAKVERLRAMKNKRRDGRNRKPSSSSVVPEENSESKSPSNEELEIQRGENLQAAAVARTKGIKLLDGKEICNNLMVQQVFQEAATAAESLLKNLPTLPASVRFIPVPQKKTSCGCGEGHDQPEQCMSAEEEKMKASGAEDSGSARLSNVALVGLRLLNDARVGLSRCLLDDAPKDVADHLKRVLLSDDSRADAWLLRGKAFHSMQVPLLAQLHYKRAAEECGNPLNPHGREIDDDVTADWNPTALMDKCREEILSGGRVHRMARLFELMQRVVIDSSLKDGEENEGGDAGEKGEEERLKCLVEEGHAIYEEGYYDTAALRYEAGARAARSMMRRRLGRCFRRRRRRRSGEKTGERSQNDGGKRGGGSGSSSKTLVTLRSLAIECHLQAAQCCLERQLGYKRATLHCTHALRLDPTNARALCARAEALMEDMRLPYALEDLSRASVLCESQVSAATVLLSKKVHQLMSKTLHRCETWMENSEYLKFTKSLELAKRPLSVYPMSIVLLITTSSSSPLRTKHSSSSTKFSCPSVSVTNNAAGNFYSLMTGIHTSNSRLERSSGSIPSSSSAQRKTQLNAPTLGHYLQEGTGPGSHDTAFCGKWHHHHNGDQAADRMAQHGFGSRLLVSDENDASCLTNAASAWIRERKEVSRKPYCVVVSLGASEIVEAAAGAAESTSSLSGVMEAARMRAESDGIDVVVITASLLGGTSQLSMEFFHPFSSSATMTADNETELAQQASSKNNKDSGGGEIFASVLDVLPTILHCGGIGPGDDRLDSFCTTLSGYAGMYNPLPLQGRDLYFFSIGFESGRRMRESQFVHDDDDDDDMFTVSLCTPPSALMAVLKGERKGPISFCADPACLHEANGGVAGIVGNTRARNEGSAVVRQYYCSSIDSAESSGGVQQEIAWFRTDELLVGNESTTMNGPLSLRSLKMKIILTTKKKEKEETIELYDVTNDSGETNDLASDRTYESALEVGMRRLLEGRDRCF